MIKKIGLLIISTILVGCPNTDTIVKNPSPKDITGDWETLFDNSTVPYLLLRMSAEGTGKLVAAGDEGAGIVFDLHSFKTLKSSFVLTANPSVDEEDKDDEVMKFEGTLDDGLLCFKPINPDEDTGVLDKAFNICFSRLEKLEEYRKSALKIENKRLF